MSKQLHPYGYWTDERVIEESKSTKRELNSKRIHLLLVKLHIKENL